MLFLIVLLSVVFCGRGDAPDLKFGNIPSLTDETFPDFLKKDSALITFYAPWCGHCKKLAPEMKKAAENLKGEFTEQELGIGVVNCEDNKDLCGKYDIRGFPTVKFFKGGKENQYEGGRTASEIEGWLKKKVGPATKVVTTIEEIEKEFEKGTIVLGCFENKDSKAYKNFYDLALKHSEFAFIEVIAAEKDIRAKYGFDEDAVFVKQLNKEIVKIEEIEKTEMFERLVDAAGYPLISEVNQNTFKRLIEPGLPLIVLFVDFNKKDEYEKYVNLLEEPAKALVGKIVFGVSDSNQFLPVYEAMGGSKDTLPGIGAMNPQKRLNFKYEGEFNTEEIVKFGESVFDGTAERYLKSDPIPESQDEDVYVLVGKEYEKIAFDEKKDVVVFIYAPWCGHCKKFHPTLDEVAEELKGVDTLLITKLDGTSNDVVDEKVTVRGFPTIIYYPAGENKNVITYNGDRSKEDFVKFLADNAGASKDAILGDKKEEKKEEQSTSDL